MAIMATSDEARKAARRWKDVDPARSRVMSLVRGKDTGPEMIVRRLVHGLGYRYALHRNDLPGKPDLVFTPRRKLIFVHGCYWHGHPDPTCRRARLPKTRIDFWTTKIARNTVRDKDTESALRLAGWDVLTIWECETPVLQRDELAKKIKRFLDQDLPRRMGRR
jgi:DNA mismatch endonuclease, patch repair protein